LRARIISVLSSPSVHKIRFRLASHTISGFGFHVVVGLLRSYAMGVVIDPLAIPAHVEAMYITADDSYASSVSAKQAVGT
jgi:hypothetical protein